MEQNIWRHQKIIFLPIFSFYLRRNLASPERTRDRVGLREKSFALSPFLCCKGLFSYLWLHFQVFSVFLFIVSGNLHQWIVLVFWKTTEHTPLVGFILYFFNEKRGENFRTFGMIHAYTESTLKKYSACTEPTRNVNLPELEIMNSSCLCADKRRLNSDISSVHFCMAAFHVILSSIWQVLDNISEASYTYRRILGHLLLNHNDRELFIMMFNKVFVWWKEYRITLKKCSKMSLKLKNGWFLTVNHV